MLWCTSELPILFILYTQPLTYVILNHLVSHMLYADDTQVYKSCNINDLASAILCVEKCMSDIKTWMLSNKLHMNEDKTEVLLVTSKRVVKLEPFAKFMNINGTSVKFCPSLRNLGVTLDSTLTTSACPECMYSYIPQNMPNIFHTYFSDY